MSTEPTRTDRSGRMRPWMLLPVLGALLLLSSLLVGLGREGADVLPSALIDRPAPEFALEGLAGRPGLATADLIGDGEVKLVNVFASWCAPCRVEHPWIEALAAEGITVHGINYKDDPANAEAFLAELGNPYTRIGADTSGRTGIEWGVYGVPETFVLDGRGRIVYRHVGPIQAGDVERRIMPAIAEARRRIAPAEPVAGEG